MPLEQCSPKPPPLNGHVPLQASWQVSPPEAPHGDVPMPLEHSSPKPPPRNGHAPLQTSLHFTPPEAYHGDVPMQRNGHVLVQARRQVSPPAAHHGDAPMPLKQYRPKPPPWNDHVPVQERRQVSPPEAHHGDSSMPLEQCSPKPPPRNGHVPLQTRRQVSPPEAHHGDSPMPLEQYSLKPPPLNGHVPLRTRLQVSPPESPHGDVPMPLASSATLPPASSTTLPPGSLAILPPGSRQMSRDVPPGFVAGPAPQWPSQSQVIMVDRPVPVFLQPSSPPPQVQTILPSVPQVDLRPMMVEKKINALCGIVAHMQQELRSGLEEMAAEDRDEFLRPLSALRPPWAEASCTEVHSQRPLPSLSDQLAQRLRERALTSPRQRPQSAPPRWLSSGPPLPGCCGGTSSGTRLDTWRSARASLSAVSAMALGDDPLRQPSFHEDMLRPWPVQSQRLAVAQPPRLVPPCGHQHQETPFLDHPHGDAWKVLACHEDERATLGTHRWDEHGGAGSGNPRLFPWVAVKGESPRFPSPATSPPRSSSPQHEPWGLQPHSPHRPPSPSAWRWGDLSAPRSEDARPHLGEPKPGQLLATQGRGTQSPVSGWAPVIAYAPGEQHVPSPSSDRVHRLPTAPGPTPWMAPTPPPSLPSGHPPPCVGVQAEGALPPPVPWDRILPVPTPHSAPQPMPPPSSSGVLTAAAAAKAAFLSQAPPRGVLHEKPLTLPAETTEWRQDARMPLDMPPNGRPATAHGANMPASREATQPSISRVPSSPASVSGSALIGSCGSGASPRSCQSSRIASLSPPPPCVEPLVLPDRSGRRSNSGEASAEGRWDERSSSPPMSASATRTAAASTSSAPPRRRVARRRQESSSHRPRGDVRYGSSVGSPCSSDVWDQLPDTERSYPRSDEQAAPTASVQRGCESSSPPPRGQSPQRGGGGGGASRSVGRSRADDLATEAVQSRERCSRPPRPEERERGRRSPTANSTATAGRRTGRECRKRHAL